MLANCSVAPVAVVLNLLCAFAVFRVPPPRCIPVEMSFGGAKDFQSLIQTCSSNIQRITHNSMFRGLSIHTWLLFPWKHSSRPYRHEQTLLDVSPAEVLCVCLSWQLLRSRVWWTSWEPGRTPATSRTTCMEIRRLPHVSAHSFTWSAPRVTIRNSLFFSCRKVGLRDSENRIRISK